MKSYKPRRRSGGFNKSRGHKQSTFDPSHLITQADQQPQASVATPKIVNQFSDFKISQQLKTNIAQHGFSTPTPIQDEVIPHILMGKDVVGIANTGTGKTAAFLIPLLHLTSENKQQRVLIITPTRELAGQIKDELRAFLGNLNILTSLCIGGTSIKRQIESLRRQPQFVIGTPGRIKDLHQRKKIHFAQFNNIVLDEVDRMLDMGFVNEIREIINRLSANRQSLFFSATINDRVKEIMHSFLTDPIIVSLKTQDTVDSIDQQIVKIAGRSKIDVLHHMLTDDEFKKVLVFGRTKRGMENLSKKLQARGIRVSAIHGNKTQSQRQRVLRQFQDNQLQALLATDVIARGVDIDNVSHVINYDLPDSYDNYIHRIGRTGRADKNGVALTFVD